MFSFDGIIKDQTFWEHFDELRKRIIKSIFVTVCCAIAAFIFKEEVFGAILAPGSSDFITYTLFNEISRLVGIGIDGIDTTSFSVKLINTGLSGQFTIHMSTSMYVGLLFAFPYLLYQSFGFILPALYDNEKRYLSRFIPFGYVMFMLGVLLSYFLIFPLTFRFLGTYQVSDKVVNCITLQS